MQFVLVAAAYGFIFVVVELIAARLRPPSEVSRKLSHVLAGIGAAALPFILSFPQIVLLGLLFVPAVFISMRSNMFRSIHGVSRLTYGELYFPLAIAVCAFLFPDTLFFMYGVLVLGVSDALASLIGTRYGSKKRRSKKGGKTIAGSMAFFVSAAIIGAGLLMTVGVTPVVPAIIWAIIVAIILTFIERHSHKGLDNLTIPIAAGALLSLLSFVGALGN